MLERFMAYLNILNKSTLNSELNNEIILQTHVIDLWFL